MRIPALAAALASCIVQCAVARADDLDLAGRHFELAKALASRGNHAGAIRELRLALAQAPGRPSLLFSLGVEHLENARALGWPRAEMEQSIHWFHRYLAALPSAPERAKIEQEVAAMNARLAAMKPDAPPAPPRVKRAPPPPPRPVELATASPASIGRIDPGNHEAFKKSYDRAVELSRKGEHEAALAEFRRALALVPAAELLRHIGEETEALCAAIPGGAAGEAADCWDRALGYYRLYLDAKTDAPDKMVVADRMMLAGQRKEEAERRLPAAAPPPPATALATRLTPLRLAFGTGFAILGAMATGAGISFVIESSTIINRTKQLDLIPESGARRFDWDLDDLDRLQTGTLIALGISVLAAAGSVVAFWSSPQKGSISVVPTPGGFAFGGTF